VTDTLHRAANPFQRILRPFAAAAIFLLIVLAWRSIPSSSLRPTIIEGIRTFVLRLGPAEFAITATLLIGVGVPRVLFAAIAGLSFGTVAGSLWASLATVAGCSLTFVAGRLLLRRSAERWLRRRPRLSGILDTIGTHGFEANLLLRALPVGNAFLTNVLLGLSATSTASFLAGTLVGTLPLTVMYASIGETMKRPSWPAIAAASTSLAVLAGLILLLRRRALAEESAFQEPW